jgi:hypothetical protein
MVKELHELGYKNLAISDLVKMRSTTSRTSQPTI